MIEVTMTAKNTRPRPERFTVCIPSNGYGSPRATRHKYVATRETTFEGPHGGPAYEFIFRCEETGEERRYGYQMREADSDVEPGPN
jgi:hypothetical protein